MTSAKKTTRFDPVDGMVVGEVGPWVTEKHARLQKFIEASRGARKKFLGKAGASYIELFSGSGRSVVKDTSQFIDGSPLVAYRSALSVGSPFSALHLNDGDPVYASALSARLCALGSSPTIYTGQAEGVVDQVVAALNPYGLHFAFLDPFNLEQLPFSIIRKLAAIKRMDMLIHVSVHDLQRNLDRYSRAGGVLDGFMPGWRNSVNANQSINPLRAALLDYWLGMISALGTTPARGIELVSGGRNQRLYWLVFVSGHKFGQKLWEDIRGLRGQSEMGF